MQWIPSLLLMGLLGARAQVSLDVEGRLALLRGDAISEDVYRADVVLKYTNESREAHVCIAMDNLALPHTLPCIPLVIGEGQYAILMPHVEKGDTFLAFSTFPAIMARRLLETLDRLHTVGYWHGDIKPGNILVRGEGAELFLIDWSYTKMPHARGPHVMPYKAPEILLNVTGGEAPADIWVVGVLLLGGLQGLDEPFFDGVARATYPLLRRHAVVLGSSGFEKYITSFNATKWEGALGLHNRKGRSWESLGIPEEAWDLLSGMLEPDPALRWTAAQALAHPFIKKSVLT